MGNVVLLITVAIAACAVAILILVLRSRKAAEDPSLNAVRYEMNLLRETTEKSMQSMGTLFSSQLQSVTSNMQSALANVSLDVSGQLENLLNMVFSRDQFELQYCFGSGDVADAVLFFPQGKVAIDSKFPLENFRRMAHAENDSEKKIARREFMKDVKRRIDEVAAKYIRPEDGTLPFALMYIPAENVYYESIIRDDEGTDLYAYCLQRRVIPVSPNSLYAYLQTILVGLNSMRVSQRAEVVLLQIESLKLELGKFAEAFETTGKHLRNAATKYNESSLMLERVENRVEHLARGASEHPQSLLGGG